MSIDNPHSCRVQILGSVVDLGYESSSECREKQNSVKRKQGGLNILDKRVFLVMVGQVSRYEDEFGEKEPGTFPVPRVRQD